MTRVDFYILEFGAEEARMVTACRITEKAWRQGNRVVLRTGSEDRAQQMDNLLWTFRDESFVPHECLSGDASEDVPVIITADECPATLGDVLVNLADDAPATPDHPARIAEIIAADAPGRARGRERFRHYRQLDYELHTHEL